MRILLVAALVLASALCLAGVVIPRLGWLVVIGIALLGGTSLWGWLHLGDRCTGSDQPAEDDVVGGVDPDVST